MRSCVLLKYKSAHLPATARRRPLRQHFLVPLRLLLQPLLLVLLLFFLFLLLEALLGWPAPQIGRRGALYTV
jgi:hypothetical protein